MLCFGADLCNIWCRKTTYSPLTRRPVAWCGTKPCGPPCPRLRCPAATSRPCRCSSWSSCHPLKLTWFGPVLLVQGSVLLSAVPAVEQSTFVYSGGMSPAEPKGRCRAQGITGTPVIDPTGHRMIYVAAATTADGGATKRCAPGCSLVAELRCTLLARLLCPPL